MAPLNPLSRRAFLGAAASTATLAAVAAAGCAPDGAYPSSRTSSQGAMVPSRRPLPEPFAQPLPLPPTLDGTRGRLALEIRQADVELIAGTRTRMLTYGGTYPGPTILARTGVPLQLDVTNTLSVNQVVHLHGGVTPPDSDGYPTDFIAPGATRSYRYPLVQAAAPLWYHDHVADMTGPNVYAGLAGAFLLGDPAEDRYGLPSGPRDLPLVVADRSFGPDAELLYPGISLGDAAAHDSHGAHATGARAPDAMGRLPGVQLPYVGGVLGDVVLVNGAPWPVAEVEAARYRLRILNGSNARRFDLHFAGDVDVIQVGSDLSLLPKPADRETVTLAPGERADVVVDFSRIAPGSTVDVGNTFATGSAGRVMRFVVTRRVRDDSRVPEAFDVDVPERDAAADVVRGLHFALARRSKWWNFLDPGPEEWSINGIGWGDDTDVFAAQLGTTERWRITANQHHPVHSHLVHMAVPGPRARDGSEQLMWKDTLDMQPGSEIEAIVPIRGFAGRYVLHCHNLEHEDHMMMAPFSVHP